MSRMISSMVSFSPDINELIDVRYELLMHIITLDKLVSISTKITDLNNGFQQLPILQWLGEGGK